MVNKIIQYGSESWIIEGKEERKLLTIEMEFWRRAWMEKIQNEVTLEQIQVLDNIYIIIIIIIIIIKRIN